MSLDSEPHITTIDKFMPASEPRTSEHRSIGLNSSSLAEIRAINSFTKEDSRNLLDSLTSSEFVYFEKGDDPKDKTPEKKGDKQKEPFIKEEVADYETEWLSLIIKDKDKISEIKKDINKNGKDPAQALVDAMKDSRVLAIGEQHVPSPNALRKMIAETIPKLKAAGATHLALEMPPSYQEYLDRFMKDGKFDEADLKKMPKPFHDKDYIAVLKAARDAGIKLVAVDAEDNDVGNPDREKAMADSIQKILKADEQNKVILIAGMLHVIDGVDMKDNPRAGALLRKAGCSTVIFGSDMAFGRPPTTLYPFACGVTKPVAVPTKGELGKHPLIAVKGAPYPLSGFDQMLIFPPPPGIEMLPPYHVK